MKHNLRTTIFAASMALLMQAGSANAVTITENFEGGSLGSTTPPAGWSLVPVSGTSSYVVTAGAAEAGLGGQISGNHVGNGSTIPAGYVVNSGSNPLDLTQPITGSFNFNIPEAGNYSSAIFFFGDIQTGIAQNAPGEWLGMFLREQTFGARASIINGAGNELATDNNNRISTGSWYTANFTWTPTAGTTGDFSYSVSGAHNWTETFSGFTFDSQEAYFAFGTGGYFSGTHSGRFDNISITGTEISSAVTVPEPATASLALLGLGGLMMRRRRMA